MKEILCPKCGMEAIGGSGFWHTTKPYCSFCGWNVERAKEIARKTISDTASSWLIFAVFFGSVAYFLKQEFALVPFLFLSVFMVANAITSWRKLKLLDASHPAIAYAAAVSSVTAAEEKTKHDRGTAHQHLWALAKPRPVRLKPVPRVISIAFPISLIVAASWGFLIARTGIVMSSDLFLLLVGAVVWCAIAITVIRGARRDRRLLAEGDLAIAVVTHQELSGSKHQRSKIQYEFKDAAGRRNHGKATDDSRELYEDMETPVFYNPANPEESVALVTASCELKQF